MSDTQVNVVREITELLRQNRLASVQSDVAEMDRILSDDWVNVTPLGCRITKQQLISGFQSGSIKTASIEAEDEEVQVYGDCAVARAIYHIQTNVRGEDLDYHIFRTDVFAKPTSFWQIVASHVTKVAPAGTSISAA